MLLKCVNAGSKMLNVMNIFNKHFTSVLKLNSPATAVIKDFIPTRHFCSANQNENSEKIDYDLITNGDKELEHKLKVLELEMEVLRQDGLLVPDNSFLTPIQWKEILNKRSRLGRIKLYECFFKLMKTKENLKAKKLEKQRQYQELLAQKEKIPDDLPIEEFAQIYNLGYNNILLRIYDTTINQLYNNKLIQAIMFGEKLVIDCGYEEHMTYRENINCAKQIMLLFAENRFHDDPFDIHLCNFNNQGKFGQAVERHIPPMYEPWFPLNVHEQSYLDIFPKDKLVYLTPHCKEEVNEFDYDAVYIIGAIVDKSNHEPLSLAKAKKEGVRMAKLPLDRYLEWGLGGKSLPLNQITSILLDLKTTRDWSYALRHIPRRKLINQNLNAATPPTDRIRPERRSHWVPTGLDFGKLRYENKSTINRKEIKKDRLVNVRSIINE